MAVAVREPADERAKVVNVMNRIGVLACRTLAVGRCGSSTMPPVKQAVAAMPATTPQIGPAARATIATGK